MKIKSIQERMAEIKKAQEDGTYRLCPRCGRATMKEPLCTNALSRSYDIMICDACGVDEAKLAFMRAPLMLSRWVSIQPKRPKDDFKALPGVEVMELLERTQIPFLKQLFETLQTTGDALDLEALRLEAHTHCPGLTTLWLSPFEARYRVSDGSVSVRLRSMEGTTQYTIDWIRNG